MNTNLLKLFAGNVVVTMEANSQAKHQFLNFIEDATEHQLKAFLLDCEIIDVPNDVFCEELIDQRFKMADLPDLIKQFEIEWSETISKM